MGRNSAIEWTDHTFNPWWGCVKVSPGCAHCYAESFSGRWGFDVWGLDKGRRLFGEKHWNDPLKWNRQARKAGIRERVFCGSMCDAFELHPDPEWNEVLDGERAKLWDLIDETPHLIWMLLTKRPENIHRTMPDRWLMDGLPRHIWFGVSTENQDALEKRWSVLDSETHYLRPSVLFLSLEPLLEPIDLEIALTEIDCGDEEHSWWTRVVDWVIVGGESGSGARPMHPDWVRSLRDQCIEADVPFFFKQWGAWKEIQYDKRERDDVQVSPIRGMIDKLPDPFSGDDGKDEFMHVVAMSKIGKKNAGRLLDGQAWDQVPEVLT